MHKRRGLYELAVTRVLAKMTPVFNEQSDDFTVVESLIAKIEQSFLFLSIKTTTFNPCLSSGLNTLSNVVFTHFF